MNNPNNLVLLAKIGAPHGVKGEVRVKAYTDDPLGFSDYDQLTDKNGKLYVVKAARIQKNIVVTRFECITTRDQAEAANGTELFVDRANFPDIETDDEFYLTDLIGMTLIDQDGIEVGKVLDLPNFGAGDLIEFRPTGRGGTEFLPFTEAIFPKINFEAQTIVTHLPEVVSERDEKEQPE